MRKKGSSEHGGEQVYPPTCYMHAWEKGWKRLMDKEWGNKGGADWNDNGKRWREMEHDMD